MKKMKNPRCAFVRLFLCQFVDDEKPLLLFLPLSQGEEKEREKETEVIFFDAH